MTHRFPSIPSKSTAAAPLAALALPIALLSLLGACGGDEQPKPAASAAAPVSAAAPAPAESASAAPTASASVTASASAAAPPPAPKPPAWLESVPKKPVTAKAGERVWDISPFQGSPNVSFGVSEVESVEGETATMSALMRMGNTLTKDTGFAPKRPFTPGLFIKAARPIDKVKPKPNDWVVSPIFGYRTNIAQIVKVDGKFATIKYVNYDKVKEETTEYVEPLQSGVVPFAFAAMKKGDKQVEAVIFAVEGDKVFGVDEQSSLLVNAKADVKPLKIEPKDRKVGSKVTVFDYTGAHETKIEKVLEPKWLYEVKVNGADRKVGFHQVVDKI